MIKNFWAWYERHLVFNISLALFLFLLQIIHLYWLGGHVIAHRLTGESYFELSGLWYYLIIVVDYTEIPALITTSLIYINELRKGYKLSSVIYLLLLLSQFLHLFWITDEFVVDSFTQVTHQTLLPAWLAWIAILIDYLEVPVMIDTARRLVVAVNQRQLSAVAEALKEKNG